MGCTPAPTCKAALAEASRRWPGRSTDSDGICGDASHQARRSDHNDGMAFDLDHDPAHGLDTWELANQLRQRCKHGDEARVAYVISNARIATKWAKDGWQPWDWRPYDGINAHKHHMHVSLDRTVLGVRNDLRPWWAFTATTPQEDPMVCAILDHVERRYRDIAGRAPDPAGLKAWVAAFHDAETNVDVTSRPARVLEVDARLVAGLKAEADRP